MLGYVIKRILLIPVILLIVTFLIYILVNLSPVDPTYNLLPMNYTQEMADELHREMGLDKPIVVQYFNWIRNALHGDFGFSWSSRIDVMEQMRPRIPITLKLSLITTFVIMIIGMPLGILCAVKQYSIWDNIFNVSSKMLGAVPQFWLALLFMLLFCLKLGWLPSYGLKGWESYIMPIVTLALPSIATYVRNTRSSMLDCIRKDYIRTARSKGAKESEVIFREALRNAVLPLITASFNQFVMLISGAVVIERVFAIPGLGSMVIEAVGQSDLPIVLACTTVMCVICVVMTLIQDIVYGLVDPRIKATFVGRS
ncbi:MAG: ABC transporter permease [Gracilibacteraceae bacterium]|jgi:peptide/nickel transport system permease protein|nr:ABC transporter permease [Gracilibacteraceae bacterium]